VGTKTIINCDYCGADITYNETGYPHQYHITLGVRDAPWPPEKAHGAVYAISMRRPATPGTDFCNIACLRGRLEETT